MKPSLILPALAFLSLLAARSPAQGFVSGSTGAAGPLAVTASTTLEVPPDGFFHFTTVSIARGVTLRFQPNARNTPVHLLATGDILIEGIIEVNGTQGSAASGGVPGPGGFRGGSPGGLEVTPGPGHGPGGGLPGSTGSAAAAAGGGSYALQGGGNSLGRGATYGNPLLFPIIGGSGGGGISGTPGRGGGGGGGAIVIASSTRIDIPSGGRVEARGGSSFDSNGGSGGAIRLVAPILAGSGALDVSPSNAGAGPGRIRLDATDRSRIAFSFNPISTLSTGAMLAVQPNPLPRLDIVEAAGNAIPVGSGPVTFVLPPGAAGPQRVRIQARDFAGPVPIRLIAQPDHGERIVVDAEIPNTAANNPATAEVQVSLPANDEVSLYVFTR